RRRQLGDAVLLADTQHDISAVQVLKVVREGADRPEGLESRRSLVPGLLQLDPGRFHAPAMEQVVEVDGQDRSHIRAYFTSRGAGPPGKPAGYTATSLDLACCLGCTATSPDMARRRGM